MSQIGPKASTQILVQADMSQSFVSEIIDITAYYSGCFHCNWSGSPVGTAIVNGSGDGINFSPLAMQPLTMSGSAGTGVLDVIATGIPYIQFAYTFTSGSGLADVFVSKKPASISS